MIAAMQRLFFWISHRRGTEGDFVLTVAYRGPFAPYVEQTAAL